jgi:hypothetical protein
MKAIKSELWLLEPTHFIGLFSPFINVNGDAKDFNMNTLKEQLHKLSDTTRKRVEMVRRWAPHERTNGIEIELLPWLFIGMPRYWCLVWIALVHKYNISHRHSYDFLVFIIMAKYGGNIDWILHYSSLFIQCWSLMLFFLQYLWIVLAWYNLDLYD